MCTNTSDRFQPQLRPHILQPWGPEKNGEACSRRKDSGTSLPLVLEDEDDEAGDKEPRRETDEGDDDSDLKLESPCEFRATDKRSAKIPLVDIVGQVGYRNSTGRHHRPSHNLMHLEHQLL